MNDIKKNEQNPLKAAALKYDAKQQDVPVIVGLGQGHIAQKMVGTANENNIPVMRDQKLANLLSKLSVGDEIPEELYEVVAQVLLFVSELDQEYKEKFGLNSNDHR